MKRSQFLQSMSKHDANIVMDGNAANCLIAETSASPENLYINMLFIISSLWICKFTRFVNVCFLKTAIKLQIHFASSCYSNTKFALFNKIFNLFQIKQEFAAIFV